MLCCNFSFSVLDMAEYLARGIHVWFSSCKQLWHLVFILWNLSQYSHALLIEIVLDVISSNSVSLISILNAVVNNVGIIDILAVFFTVILFMKSRQKKELDLFDCSLYIDVCCSRGKLFYGFQVSSIDELVSILHILSMITLGFECVIIVYLIYRIVRLCFWVYSTIWIILFLSCEQMYISKNDLIILVKFT